MKAKKKLVLKKYPEGTASVKKIVSSKSEPLDTYTRETTTTYETSPGSKGKLYIAKGTVQRNPSGKGVSFKPEGTEEVSKTGKVVDPKSRKLESDNQAMLRKAALDSHEGINLENRYKEGDTVTYQTKKGPQVAGKIQKTPDVPATYQTSKQREVQVSKKGDVQLNRTGTKKQILERANQLKSQGYRDQGNQGWVKDDEHIFVPEEHVADYESKGYFRSDRAKQQLEQKKKGSKKIKLYKKGSKMC
jgi:hypothetical protein